MSEPLGIKKLFPSVTKIYEEVSTPPEQGESEHPYEYLTRAYEDSSLNSRLTGLPGYSPPWFIRILNGATAIFSYITMFLSLVFVFILGCTVTAAVIETISTIEFTLWIPYTGWEIYTFPLSHTSRSFVLTASPALISFLSVWVSMMVFIGFNNISSKVSRPYEDEYYEWLQELEPPENGFPAGLAYAWRENEFDYGEIPTAAPPALREQRRFETIVYVCKTIYKTIVAFFVRTMTFHMIVLYEQHQQTVEPPLDAFDDPQATRKSRQKRN